MPTGPALTVARTCLNLFTNRQYAVELEVRCTDVVTVAIECIPMNDLHANVVACRGEVTIAGGMHGLG
jgi:hypothetical protein